ncbi:tetratricopeptide repeat (TPR)-like superfamily protein [Actinidia rufa]|uniref:Tetratricopeptide repeat (TPR)-like superfamily protein n=1 Tax=Actinidia rufa TaxID=165716 RepID=A0A7J0FCB0_9ERIC|nr:tetratricopeptide repeat (TPR)-like superfamily protein [Actinidia rufa]
MASLPINTTLNPHTPHSKTTKSPNLTPTHLTTLQENGKNNRILYKSYIKQISSLCKDGQIQEAVDLFTDMQSESFQIGPEIYGELLQGCVFERDLLLGQQIHALIIKNGELFARNETGFSENALLGFCEMQENGFLGDNFVVPNVLKACGALQLIGFGKGVHGYVLKMGFGVCVFVASSLVDMYGKCGVWGDARKVFDEMLERNVVAWNSMIASYVQNAMSEEAVDVFHDMRVEGVEPTHVTIASFLSASANLCAVVEGKQGHAIAIVHGLELDNILGTSMINFYSKVGLIEDAELVFSRMLEKDVVTWNLLISCYVQHGLVESALNLCQLMRLENFRFDSVTLALILSASANTSNLKLGQEGHCYCIRHNFESDVVVASNIVNMYGKCGKINHASSVFSSTTKRDLVLWNTLMGAYAEQGLSGEAIKLFYQMQLESVPPNVISWNSVILGFLRSGQVNKAKDMFSQMKALGFQPNLITWTTLVSGMVQNGFGDEAILLFQKMLESETQPNILSIMGVLSACTAVASLQFGRAIHGHAGLVNEGLEFFVDMVSERDVEPTMEHYGCVVSLLSRHGNLDEALMLILRMPFDPDARILGSLLAACREHQEIEIGEYISKLLFELEPGSSGNFIALSNTYAAAERWDEVSRLRVLMKQKGLKKNPGCSWIQIGREIHAFVAGDASHSETNEIYSILALLRQEMQLLGYVQMVRNDEILCS